MVEKLDLNTPEYAQLEERIQQNQLLIQELNTQVHDAAAVRELVSQITGRPVDESTEIRLPFYTDCGVRLHLGKRVFINSNCMFTDLGSRLAKTQLWRPGRWSLRTWPPTRSSGEFRQG